MEMTKQTLELSKSDLEQLRRIAADLGLTIGRGPLAERGSIRQLNEEIAQGKLQLVKVED